METYFYYYRTSACFSSSFFFDWSKPLFLLLCSYYLLLWLSYLNHRLDMDFLCLFIQVQMCFCDFSFTDVKQKKFFFVFRNFWAMILINDSANEFSSTEINIFWQDILQGILSFIKGNAYTEINKSWRICCLVNKSSAAKRAIFIDFTQDDTYEFT